MPASLRHAGNESAGSEFVNALIAAAPIAGGFDQAGADDGKPKAA